MNTYAIGDIHGNLIELEKLLMKIKLHASGSEYKVITLGDYVDRGLDSRGVVSLLRRLESKNFICLKGNHEEMMYDALIKYKTGMYRAFWLNNGGDITLKNYKFDEEQMLDDARWLNSRQLFFQDDLRFYVHAGVLNEVPLSNQSKVMKKEFLKPEEVYLWIREEFLESPYKWEKLIVHGHTPTSDHLIDIRKNRVCLDIGSRKLCAAVFNDTQAHPINIIYSS